MRACVRVRLHMRAWSRRACELQRAQAELAVPDPEAPNDEEEIMYWVRIDSSQAHDTEAAEETSLKMAMDLDADGLKAVTAADGVFGNGVGVCVPMASDKGTAAFHDAAAKAEGCGSGKNLIKLNRKPRKPEDKPEENPLEAADPLEAAKKQRDRCLEDCTQANKFALQLKAKEYSDKLLLQFREHEKFMKNAYDKYEALISQNTKDTRTYAALAKVCEPKFAWFQERRAVAEGMLKAVPKARKAKAKAKSSAAGAAAASPPEPAS